MFGFACLVVRPESNGAADDAGAEMKIKNEIKTEATTDDVVDSKDRLQTLITSTNIKSE